MSNYLIAYFAVSFFLSAALAAYARHLGRQPIYWFIASMVFSPAIVGGILFLSGRRSENNSNGIFQSHPKPTITNTSASWGALSRALHWAMAAIIFYQLAVGFYMVEIIGNDLIQRFELTQTHKSWGFVVFALGLLRILWRWVNPTPVPPEMPGWQRRASAASHVALYVLMVAIPVSGWLMASASPLNDEGAYPMQVKNMVFGLFELPDPFAPGSKALTEVLEVVHAALAATLAAILLVHMAAALKHQFVDRDGLLRRMIVGRS